MFESKKKLAVPKNQISSMHRKPKQELVHGNLLCFTILKRPLPTMTKVSYIFIFRFYPYIMLISCVFLLVTLLIYSIVPGLLNHYTRIMRHFVATILIAFLIMVVNQMEYKDGHLKDIQPEFCLFLGKSNSYWSTDYSISEWRKHFFIFHPRYRKTF